MGLREPKSADECVYFTRRSMGSGSAKAWVFRGDCPKCKKGLMGKPRNPKTGKPKMRATEYVCPECGHSVEKVEYEESLTANVKYTCPKCGKSDETQVPFKRKKVKIFNEEDQKEKIADALQIVCSKCNEKINITKKMKG